MTARETEQMKRKGAGIWNSGPGVSMITVKVPPPIRRHEFRYAKCARRTFMCGRTSAAGHMKVTVKVPPPNRRHEFRYAKCIRRTFVHDGLLNDIR